MPYFSMEAMHLILELDRPALTLRPCGPHGTALPFIS